MNAADVDAYLLDIEGTTTSISFVYDELFPFARREMAAFLQRSMDVPEVRADVAALAAQARIDRSEGIDAPEVAQDDASDAELVTTAVRNALWQMDNDRKTTGLKSLQGKIWVDGYARGDLKGHVYDDVPVALDRWHRRGTPIYIYSSGSVAAQKLLFGHSIAGDLTEKLAGYFDTTTGPKKVASSYEKIAGEIGVPVARVLFATDSLDEARAADDAGMPVVLSVRPGNPQPPEHGFPVIHSLSDLP